MTRSRGDINFALSLMFQVHLCWFSSRFVLYVLQNYSLHVSVRCRTVVRFSKTSQKGKRAYQVYTSFIFVRFQKFRKNAWCTFFLLCLLVALIYVKPFILKTICIKCYVWYFIYLNSKVTLVFKPCGVGLCIIFCYWFSIFLIAF